MHGEIDVSFREQAEKGKGGHPPHETAPSIWIATWRARRGFVRNARCSCCAARSIPNGDLVVNNSRPRQLPGLSSRRDKHRTTSNEAIKPGVACSNITGNWRRDISTGRRQALKMFLTCTLAITVGQVSLLQAGLPAGFQGRCYGSRRFQRCPSKCCDCSHGHR